MLYQDNLSSTSTTTPETDNEITFSRGYQSVDVPGRTIIVCDCNSDPADGTTKAGDTKRHWAPYFLIEPEGGFHDTWLQWAPPEGFTSGLGERVDDETAKGCHHRIDMVFARTGKGHRLPVLDDLVTGDEVEDNDPVSGLWPSDHAGVVMKLRLK